MTPSRAPRVRPVLLLLSSCVWASLCYPFRTPVELDLTPRITVPYQGLQGVRSFHSPTVNHSALLLEPDSPRLYVGARGAVFALDAADISSSAALKIEWEASPEQKQQCLTKGKDNKTECFNHIRLLQRFNSTHLFACGTHAFRPLCAFIDEERFEMSAPPEDGRDKCPYGPGTGYTGLIIEQQIYTATQYEFRSFPDIRRNAPAPALKTEDAPTRWLNEADFVGSALVKESTNSATGDDDKIYFFFTERTEELAHSSGRVSRVARVCKGDRGGRLTLQKRWTSFLKARLVCSLPEFDFHFNILRSVFVLPDAAAPQHTLFFGIFGLEWKNVKASAVCRFSQAEVRQAFSGPYMESQDSGAKWSQYSGRTPEPRPGTCITDSLRARGINVSTSLPDEVLNFVRRHPLMSQQVQPTDRRPLLFRRSTDYTQLAVHVTEAVDGQEYHVLYLGTDDGWLHKAVEVEGQLHIIEELQLFEEAQPVSSVLLSTQQKSVYVGAPSGVVQLPLSSCQRYLSCYDCVFSRDPHCAWDGDRCADIWTLTNRSSLIQDIQHGSRGCEDFQPDVAERSRSVRVGDDVLLQCELSSNLASSVWTQDGRDLHGYGLSSGFRTGTDGLLIIDAKPDQTGLYTCYAKENHIRVPIVTYNVSVQVDTPTQFHIEPIEDVNAFTLPPLEEATSTGTPLAPPPAPRLPTSNFLTAQNMEALYLTLITILGGLCIVLTVVLLYVGFCLRAGNRGKYSLRDAAAAYPIHKKPSKNKKHHRNSAHLELKTISSHCNGYANGSAKHHNGGEAQQNGGFLQIVPGEGHTTSNRDSPPPAPPLPPTSPSHASTPDDCEFTNGLSATLPSMLRRINGNSYVLLRQSDSGNTSPNGHSFTDELNKILEKRKHTQILPRPDESSV